MEIQFAPPHGSEVPTVVTAGGDRVAARFNEYFSSHIRNEHTRRAYGRAAADFLAWCEEASVGSIADVREFHVTTWIDLQTREHSTTTVKLRLAALRKLFDWLVTGGVIPTNPAAAVRAPKCRLTKSKTKVLEPAEARKLLDTIDVNTPIGLRDRALIAMMIFSFARIGAALAMRVDDVFTRNRQLWVRLRERDGKAHCMPCHHTLAEYLHAYIDGTGIASDPEGPLFRTIGSGTGRLTRTALPQPNAFARVRRWALAAGIDTKVGNHSFRAMGITTYLSNGGTLENAAAMASHTSIRTTQLYSRQSREISLDEVERLKV